MDELRRLMGLVLVETIRASVELLETDPDLFKVVDSLRRLEVQLHDARRSLESVIYGE